MQLCQSCEHTGIPFYFLVCAYSVRCKAMRKYLTKWDVDLVKDGLFLYLSTSLVFRVAMPLSVFDFIELNSWCLWQPPRLIGKQPEWFRQYLPRGTLQTKKKFFFKFCANKGIAFYTFKLLSMYISSEQPSALDPQSVLQLGGNLQRKEMSFFICVTQ